MWYFLLFQVNTSCATFKLFKTLLLLILCHCLLAHEGYVEFLYHSCQTDFHQWTSGIYIRLSINLAKRAGKWGAQSQLISTLTANSLHIFVLIKSDKQ